MREYRAKGLDFITISLDDLSEIKTTVPKFLREMRATMPIYLLNVSDPEPAIKSSIHSGAELCRPRFFTTEKARLVFKHFGRVNPVELRAAIQKSDEY